MHVQAQVVEILRALAPASGSCWKMALAGGTWQDRMSSARAEHWPAQAARWNSVLALHETTQNTKKHQLSRQVPGLRGGVGLTCGAEIRKCTSSHCAQMTTSRDSARSNDVRVSCLEQGMGAPCPPCRISPARGLLLRGAHAPARSPARGGRPWGVDPFWWEQRIRHGFSNWLNCAAPACPLETGGMSLIDIYS